jgi:DNA-binding NarL/FixJ family response regulator
MAWSADARLGQPVSVFDPVIVGGVAHHVTQPALNTQAMGEEEARRGYLTSGPVITSKSVSLGDRSIDPIRLWRSEGVQDFMALIATSAEGFAILLGAPQPCVRHIRKDELAWLSRLSAHLGSAFRLRVSLRGQVTPLLAGGEAEAIFDASGRVAHAAPQASARGVLAQLRRAVLDRDRARSSQARLDSSERLSLWPGLVAGRWSLVDEFDSDQRRYVIAVRNSPDAAVVRGLTLRERQIVGYVALGWSNKATAYAMGIGESTVAAHLWRASRKLGVRQRTSLIQLVQAAGPHSGSPHSAAAAQPCDASEPTCTSESARAEPNGHRAPEVMLVELRNASLDLQRAGLSAAERQVLMALLDGSSYAQIAAQRRRALGTVAKQASSVLRKLGVSSRSELSALSVTSGERCTGLRPGRVGARGT